MNSEVKVYPKYVKEVIEAVIAKIEENWKSGGTGKIDCGEIAAKSVGFHSERIWILKGVYLESAIAEVAESRKELPKAKRMLAAYESVRYGLFDEVVNLYGNQCAPYYHIVGQYYERNGESVSRIEVLTAIGM